MKPTDHEIELEPGPPPEEDRCPICQRFDCVCQPESMECQHQYAERTTAPLGVTCIKCGHFVGAWE